MANIWDVGAGASPYAAPTPTPTANNYWYNGGAYNQTQDFYNTPVSGNIREQNLPLAFASWGNRQGVADNDSTFSRWFQNQLPRFQRGYGQATMDNPMMNVDQFMATLPGYQGLRNEFNSLSPNARGANYSLAPSVRWIPR